MLKRVKIGEHYYGITRDVRGRIVGMEMWHCMKEGCEEHSFLHAMVLVYLLTGAQPCR